MSDNDNQELTKEDIDKLEILVKREYSYLQDQKRRAELSNGNGAYDEAIVYIDTKSDAMAEILTKLMNITLDPGGDL